MRAIVLLSVIALAAAGPKKLSSKFLSTPMARGGGRIVGGTEAYPGEFPHQIALLRGGVGGSNLYEDDPDQADIAVDTVANHEDYDSWTIENDICMLWLADSADFSSSVIDTIGIPSSGQEYPSGHMCTVSGWGTTS